jgi:pseudouridine-5'-phosphate glycosidase
LREADQQGVKGKLVTPFLLARIKELTGGRSLATNIALVKHNALVGAQLAVALHAAE